uniref:Solute carrier family 25 member 28 n=1 Tax=Erpetoichthys calabaricus TaxID=27687 RepID=A0A8C4RG74_ERPCA
IAYCRERYIKNKQRYLVPVPLIFTYLVKQRMQMFNSPYRSVLDWMRAVWQKEGQGLSTAATTTQLTMNVPFQALHFMAYEYLQELLNPHRQYKPSTHMISGALAGALATLLNTQESLALNSLNVNGHISGLAHAFRTVYRLGGIPAYFKGVQARVIYQMPSTAISWSVYEFFKYLLPNTSMKKEKHSNHSVFPITENRFFFDFP